MTINRTTLLDLPLPVTGTESGTWGNITNNGLSQYVDIAVAGMNALTSSDFTAGALTISNTQGDSGGTNIAAGSAQYATIKVSSLAQNSTITAPASNRSYKIINADSTYNLTIKASGQTGVTFLPGQTGVVAFTGTDYEVVGVVNAASSTDNAVPKFDGTTGQIIQNTGVTIDDSNNVSGVAQLNATTADLTNIEVTNIKAKDGTAAGSIADSTGVVTLASSVLTTTDINGGTIDNTAIGGATPAAGAFTTLSASSTVTLSGGTANGVAYLDGSKVLTTGSALTFNGTELGTTSTGLNINNANALVRYQNGSGTRTGYLQVRADAFDIWSDQAAVPMVFGVANSEQMRLTSTGLGIGTSSPAAKLEIAQSTDNTDGPKLRIANNGNTLSNGQLIGGIDFFNGDDSGEGVGAYIYSYTTDSIGRAEGQDLRFATGGTTERMRIDSSGNLLVGATSNPNANGVYIVSNQNRGMQVLTGSSATGWVINGENQNTSFADTIFLAKTAVVAGSTSQSLFVGQYDSGNTTCVRIYGNGNIENLNNSYGALSDVKLKENIVDATPKLEKLNQVRIVNFNIIGSEQKQLGVIAQELEQIFPGMVDESPDRDAEGNDLGTTTKSVKYSVFVPMLIKAMQEQQEIIESLKSRLDAAGL